MNPSLAPASISITVAFYALIGNLFLVRLTPFPAPGADAECRHRRPYLIRQLEELESNQASALFSLETLNLDWAAWGEMLGKSLILWLAGTFTSASASASWPWPWPWPCLDSRDCN